VGATFGQLLDQWLEECERLDLSPTTLRNYESSVRTSIRPRLGQVPLSTLSAKHLDTLYGAMKAAGKSPKTIRNHHAAISAALHQGVRWGWVRSNVAELARPPRIAQKRVRAPSIDVVRKVIDEAERRDPHKAALLMLAALSGMRRGELCALRWSDLDLDAGTMEVARSVVVIPGGLAEKAPKTDRSRSVALDAVAVALLRHHHARTVDKVTEAHGQLAPDAFVFSPFTDCSIPYRPDNVTSFFIRVRNEVGAKTVKLHDLRHFTATQLKMSKCRHPHRGRQVRSRRPLGDPTRLQPRAGGARQGGGDHHGGHSGYANPGGVGATGAGVSGLSRVSIGAEPAEMS
jgi:integrase